MTQPGHPSPQDIVAPSDAPTTWPWQTLVEHHPDFLMLTDRDTTILFINRVEPGPAVQDVIGKRGIDYLPAEHRAAVLEHCARAWDTGNVVEFEVPAMTAGRLVWYYARMAPVRRADRTECLMTVVRDITDRRRADEERLALQQSLQEARRLESLGLLAGGVAHDFNNLLTGILGHAALARQTAPEGLPLHEHLREVEKLCQRAADLCRQMLAFAGKARLVLGPLDLNGLIEESQALLRLSIPRHLTLEVRPCESLPPIRADAVPVWQALLNLVVNAAEAIGGDSGTITVATGAVHLDDAFLRTNAAGRNLPAGAYVFVEVRDTGAGMTDEVRARMFEPFFSTKFTGRGLGLPAVQGTVHGHRGIITVQTAPGRGTAVRLLFPRTDELAAAV
jgi:PAS domain S-box-containing protein